MKSRPLIVSRPHLTWLQLFMSDLNNIKKPFRIGNAVARGGDFDCLDWNKKVSHILATGSSEGFVTVWDVKTKKESLTLNNYGRKAASAIAWDPEKVSRQKVPSTLRILIWFTAYSPGDSCP